MLAERLAPKPARRAVLSGVQAPKSALEAVFSANIRAAAQQLFFVDRASWLAVARKASDTEKAVLIAPGRTDPHLTALLSSHLVTEI